MRAKQRPILPSPITPAAKVAPYFDARGVPLPPADGDLRWMPDLQLFGFEGPALVGRIREEGARTSILYTSGYADDALTGQHGRDERIHFLAKPYTGTTLLRKIREVLDTKTSAAGGSAG